MSVVCILGTALVYRVCVYWVQALVYRDIIVCLYSVIGTALVYPLILYTFQDIDTNSCFSRVLRQFLSEFSTLLKMVFSAELRDSTSSQIIIYKD